MTEKESIADKVRDHATDDIWPALVVPPVPIPRPDSAPESCARRR
jgi:hypothetical protein